MLRKTNGQILALKYFVSHNPKKRTFFPKFTFQKLEIFEIEFSFEYDDVT